jgi:2-polyprenyl-3-methyl-5-hydroxy-6-metoxy-1,4-benzoquinol methylase
MDYKQYKQMTRGGYRNKGKASSYKKAYVSPIGLNNFKDKIVANREKIIVKSFLNYLQQKENLPKNVLDVPVGTGKMTEILLNFDLEVLSGDISKEMIELINPQLKKRPNYLGEEIMDASKLVLEDSSFDLILNIRLLHRVDSLTRKKIIKEIQRVSRKYCIVSFAEDSLWHNLCFKLQGRKKIIEKIKLNRIKREFKEAGFRLVKIRRVFPTLSSETICLFEK